jgi:hypothetical protein
MGVPPEDRPDRPNGAVVRGWELASALSSDNDLLGQFLEVNAVIVRDAHLLRGRHQDVADPPSKLGGGHFSHGLILRLRGKPGSLAGIDLIVHHFLPRANNHASR